MSSVKYNLINAMPLHRLYRFSKANSKMFNLWLTTKDIKLQKGLTNLFNNHSYLVTA